MNLIEEGKALKITKVDDYEFIRDCRKGQISKEDTSVLIEDIPHSNLEAYITARLRRELLSGLKGKSTDEEIKKKRSAIRKIIRNISVKDEKVYFKKNNVTNIESAIKVLNKCKYPKIDKNKKPITKNQIIAYNFIDGKSLNKKSFEKVIIGLMGKKKLYDASICEVFEVNKCQLFNLIDLDEIKEEYEVWQKNTQKSVDKNKIRTFVRTFDGIKVVDRMSFRHNLYEKLLDSESEYDNELKKYKEEYDFEKLIKVINSILTPEGKNTDKSVGEIVEHIKTHTDIGDYNQKELKKKISENPYFKNNVIKKSLIGYQRNHEALQMARKDKSGLNYYDEEVMAYFNKYYPLKRRQGDNKSDVTLDKEHWKLDEKIMSAERIHNEISNRLKNKAINAAIRTGQIIEHRKIKEKPLSNLTNRDLEIMHIQDVFSRKLSSAITYATNEFRNEVFGEGTEKKYEKYLTKEVLIKINDETKIKTYNIGEEIQSKILVDEIRSYYEEIESNIGSVSNKLNQIYNCLVKAGISNNLKKVEGQERFDKYKVRNFIRETIKRVNDYKNGNIKKCEEFKKVKEKYLGGDFLTNKEESKKLDNVLQELDTAKILIEMQGQNMYPFIRASIFAFRNTSFHYQNTLKIEFIKKNDATKGIAHIKNDIKNRIKEIPKCELLKAYGNAVFQNFEVEKIFGFYKDNDLYYPKENNKMPSFKNILKSYRNLGKSKMGLDYRLLEQLIGLHKLSGTAEEIAKKQAQKYLLIKLYNAKYQTILKKVQALAKGYYNKKVAVKTDVGHYSKIKEAIESKEYGDNEAFFINLKSAIQKDKATAELRNKESGFAFDIEKELVAFAFCEMLKEQNYDAFIFKEQKQIEAISEKKLLKKFKFKEEAEITLKKLEIKPSNDLIYAFYAMTLMLSKARVSELYNNMVSYQQAYTKLANVEKEAIRIYENGDYFIELDEVFKVLRILIHSSEGVAEDTSKRYDGLEEDRYMEILKTFIDFENKADLVAFNKELDNREQLYIQKDGETLVKFRQIIEADQERLLKKYEDYYEAHKISCTEVKDFNILEGEIHGITNRLEELKKIINKNQKVFKSKAEYCTKYKKKLEYIWLKNRLLLNDVSKMSRLMIDVYSRLTGLIAVLEKDLTHLMVEKGILFEKDIGIIKAFISELSLNKLHSYNDKDEGVRNNFAHFDYLRDTQKSRANFIEQLNSLRKLLRMDRKLKNAVTKTVIKTFDKHGFMVTFTFDKHNIASYRVKRKELEDQYLTNPKKVYPEKDYMLEMIEQIIFKEGVGCRSELS